MASVLASSLNELCRTPITDEKERKEVYDTALRLAWSLESQQDTAQRLYHGHLPLATAQTGIDIGIFNFLSENAKSAFTIDQLSTQTGAEPALLRRLLGFYASQRMILQTPEGRFCASNISHNLSKPGTEAGIKHYSLTMTNAYQAIPEFLSKTHYRNPISSTSTPFNLAYNTDLPVFEWRKHNPKNASAGQKFMAAQRMGQRSVWDGQTTLTEFEMSDHDIKRGRVMMCDVGGGMGHQCVELRKYRPDLKGRIVTEDLPLVQNMIINREELSSLDITLQNHNFMEEQPIKGAKVYYLRNVIHNWNDEPSKTILSQISQSMAVDSVLILDEVVMPQVGVSWKQASMDLAMMTMLAAKERTKAEFNALLASANLQIREIRTYDEDYGDSLIIAELSTRVDEKFDEPFLANGGNLHEVSWPTRETNGNVLSGDAAVNGAEINGTALNDDAAMESTEANDETLNTDAGMSREEVNGTILDGDNRVSLGQTNGILLNGDAVH